MSHDNFALQLCTANADLQLECSRLLLENTQRSVELLQRAATQGIAEAKVGIDGLQNSTDKQFQSPLSPEILVAMGQRYSAQSREIAQQAMQNQATLMTGLQQALICWLQATTRNAGKPQTTYAMPEWLKPWIAPQPQQNETETKGKE